MIFKILCDKGDDEFDYDLDTAAIKFDELKSAGYLPVVSGKEAISEFDPDAKEIVWMPAIMGG